MNRALKERLETLFTGLYNIRIDGSYLDEGNYEFVKRFMDFFVDLPEESNELRLKGQEFLYFLMFYARSHFKQEEEFFRNMEYPWINEHTQAHLEFIKTLTYFESRLKMKGFSSELVDDIEDFVIGWSLKHIGDEDRKVAEFFHKKEEIAA